MDIEKIEARKIANSRGEESIEVSIVNNNGKFSTSAPSGKSKGKYEASAFPSSGVDGSIKIINKLSEKIIKVSEKVDEFEELERVEDEIRKVDKTTGWNLIGANALFALEASMLKLMARERGRELWKLLIDGKRARFPFPVGNAIGGGMHSENSPKPDIQEFLFIPKEKEFFENVFLMKHAKDYAYDILKDKDRKFSGRTNDENAWQTSFDNDNALRIMQEVCQRVMDKFETKIEIGIDAAASSFFRFGKYEYKNKQNKLEPIEQVYYMEKLAKGFSLEYIEDPLQEEDFENFAKLTGKAKCLIVGDDLTVTSLERLKQAVKKKSITGIIIKPNQNGSLVETKKVIDFAKKNDIKTIISHRSGETEDNTIADLAVAWQADYIKTGISGREREAKLKRIIEIEKSVK